MDFSYTSYGFVICWCPISLQQHFATCQVDLKWPYKWKCSILSLFSSLRHFTKLKFMFQGQKWMFSLKLQVKSQFFWPKLSHIKLLHCLNSSFQYFYQYLMDSFVLKSISRNHHLRICFMWSLWKFPVKLDRTRLRYAIIKKNDIIWEIFPNVGPPPFGNPLS